jgi:alpha-D-ribose 1-methylphosphonate 5-triphosphate diphosphatase PhnM
VILKSETYNFHRLDLTRQAGFIVTVYDEDGLRLAATMPFSAPAEAFEESRKIHSGRRQAVSDLYSVRRSDGVVVLRNVNRKGVAA